MAKEWNRKFSELVNALEATKDQYLKGIITKERVKEITDELLSEMNEEELDAFLEYERERERQALESVENLKNEVAEAEAVLARRRKSHAP